MTPRRLIALLVFVAAPSPARPRRVPPDPAPDWLWGGGFHASVPTGDFADARATRAGGAAAHAVVLPHERPFGLRLEVSALVYGSRSFTSRAGRRGPHDPHRHMVRQHARRSGASARAAARCGPTPHLLAGVGYFATSTESSAYYETVPMGGATNFDDATFAWAAGGGVEIAAGRDVSIDLGARYLANGTVDYFTQDSVGRRGHGRAPAAPRRGARGDVHGGDRLRPLSGRDRFAGADAKPGESRSRPRWAGTCLYTSVAARMAANVTG